MTSSEQRSIEVEEKNKEKRESKQAAVSAISSGSVDLGQLVESASKENKSLGRKTVREIRRAQSTGRISNWLAQETLKFQSQQEASRAVGYSDSSSGFRSINQPQSFSLDPNPQSDKYISSYLGKDPTTTTTGGGDTPAHPWKITIRTTPDSDPPEYEYKIEPASILFDGFGGTQVDVSGADGVFRNVEEGYYFIEVDFSGGDVDQAQIQIDGNIGEFVETSGDPPEQTKLRQQIGYVFFEDGVPKVRQNAWHNYTLFDACRNGAPVKVAIAT